MLWIIISFIYYRRNMGTELCAFQVADNKCLCVYRGLNALYHKNRNLCFLGTRAHFTNVIKGVFRLYETSQLPSIDEMFSYLTPSSYFFRHQTVIKNFNFDISDFIRLPCCKCGIIRQL